MSNRRPAVSFLPATAVLELTYRCNHCCIFCSCPWEGDDGRFAKLPELGTDEWKSVLSKLCRMGVSNLAFTGGEPLLREDLPEIIRHAADLTTEHIETVDGNLVSRFAPPSLYLLSNGEKVNAEILDLFHRYAIQLSMSLPGLCTFHDHTGSDNADHILAMFSAARARGLKTIANITVTRLNLPELGDTIAAAFLAGAEQILLNRFLPGGRGIQHAHDLQLSLSDIREMLDITENMLEVAGRFGSLGAEIPRCAIGNREYKHLQVSSRCSAAIQFFVIDPSGYTRVCNHSPVRLNHVDTLDQLKSNEYWKRFVRKDYLPERCHGCSNCHDCDGGCREAVHITTGELDAVETLIMSESKAGRIS